MPGLRPGGGAWGLRRANARHLPQAKVAWLAEKRRVLLLGSDARAVWDGGHAKVATAIRGARYLNNEQRKKLFGEIMAIELGELKDETRDV